MKVAGVKIIGVKLGVRKIGASGRVEMHFSPEQDSMNVTINGETKSTSAETLSALIESLGMKSDRVAIELNREIVPREKWPETPLHDGDKLEIVHFVGGGNG